MFSAVAVAKRSLRVGATRNIRARRLPTFGGSASAYNATPTNLQKMAMSTTASSSSNTYNDRVNLARTALLVSTLLAAPAILLLQSDEDEDDVYEKQELARATTQSTSTWVGHSNSNLSRGKTTICEVPKLRVGLRETRRPTRRFTPTNTATTSVANSSSTTATATIATATQTTEMTNFQVLNALHEKQELEMLRMAKILHDLHELATSYGDQPQADTDRNEITTDETHVGRMQRLRQFFLKPFKTRLSSSRAASIDTETDPSSSKKNTDTDAATAELSESSSSSDSISGISMSLRDDTLSNISPKRAQELIAALLQGQRFDQDSLVLLLQASESMLKQDETLVDLRGVSDKVAVVGDLHGSLQSLQNVLRLIGTDDIGKTQAVVFNGDFVDRGSDSIEVICTLLLMKLAHPKHVILLRGNHEDTLVASAYGFQDEVRAKYGGGADMQGLWDAFCNIFSALPICVRTECSAILHGGLPSDHFSLTDLQAISVDARCLVATTVEPKDDVTRLLEGILWSDPSPRPGIHPNTHRGCGVFFGPEIARDFLERHDLLYLIRGHEVVETGTKILDCGGGRAVLTVFSSAAYPDGQGCNLGAVIHVDKEGGCHSSEFSHEECVKENEVKDPYGGALRHVIAASKSKLEKAFTAIAVATPEPTDDYDEVTVTSLQWAQVMSETLELPDIPWMALQPFLAPTTERDGDLIRWREFLDTHSVSVSPPVQVSDGNGNSNHSSSNNNKQAKAQKRSRAVQLQSAMDGVAMEILYANHSMLVTVFQFFDVEGNGKISLKEFMTGIKLMNKRLPADKQLKDAEELFAALDLDGSGSVDLEEFSEVFRVL